jgi:hypothetical protein
LQRRQNGTKHALATLGLSASNSYRLFPPSRETRWTMMRNAAEDDLPFWHETTLLMWYDDVLPLSKTALAALFAVGIICTTTKEPKVLVNREGTTRVIIYVRECTTRRLRVYVHVSRRSSASFGIRCISTIRPDRRQSMIGTQGKKKKKRYYTYLIRSGKVLRGIKVKIRCV